MSDRSANEHAARVPLVPADTTDPVIAPVFAGVRARGGEPLNLHRAMANAPGPFKAQVDYAIALRTQASLPRALRELVILRVAHVEDGDYEFAQHKPMALSHGLTAEQIAAVADCWRDSAVFDEEQRVVLAYVDAMLRPDSVDDETFAAVARRFTAKEIVELTMTVSFYTGTIMSTRALRIELEPNAGQTAYGKA